MDNIQVLIADPAAWGALGALIAMEVVLGIDNLIFISILTNKLPEHQRERARRIGISAAPNRRRGLLAPPAHADTRPRHRPEGARRIGVSAALILRRGLLSTVSFIVQLTEPLFTAF